MRSDGQRRDFIALESTKSKSQCSEGERQSNLFAWCSTGAVDSKFDESDDLLVDERWRKRRRESENSSAVIFRLTKYSGTRFSNICFSLHSSSFQPVLSKSLHPTKTSSIFTPSLISRAIDVALVVSAQPSCNTAWSCVLK